MKSFGHTIRQISRLFFYLGRGGVFVCLNFLSFCLFMNFLMLVIATIMSTYLTSRKSFVNFMQCPGTMNENLKIPAINSSR